MTGFCQDFSPLPVIISPLLHTHSVAVCNCQRNNTTSKTELFDEAISEGMSRFRVCRFIWNENQLMSLFYSNIAGSLHVSGPQAHLQESSYSCSHNHCFSICAALFACSVCCLACFIEHTEHSNRAAQILNQWLYEQLYEIS